MFKQNSRQTGFSLIEILVIIAILAIIGAASWVAVANYRQAKNPAVQTPSPTPKAKDPFCSDKETATAASGTFCSQDIGIKFKIPSMFAGKVTQAKNYEVFKGSIDPATKTSAGMSETVYSANISGNDNFTLTISKEPLRSGYTKVGHNLTTTYFNQVTGSLNVVVGPINYYNSATDKTTVSGTYSIGDAVPSFMVGTTRVFKGEVGDAGTSIISYLAVIHGKIITIQITNNGYMGDPAKDPTTIDVDSVLNALDAAVKNLQISA